MANFRRQPQISRRLVNLRATDEELDLIDRLAKHLGITSRGETIRHIIGRWLESPAGVEAARAAAGAPSRGR